MRSYKSFSYGLFVRFNIASDAVHWATYSTCCCHLNYINIIIIIINNNYYLMHCDPNLTHLKQSSHSFGFCEIESSDNYMTSHYYLNELLSNI